MNGMGNLEFEGIKIGTATQRREEKISDPKTTVIYFTIDKFARASACYSSEVLLIGTIVFTLN
jgi:hypothetical protein